MKEPKQLRFFSTYSQRFTVYQQCPELLAEDLLIVFGPIETDEDKGVHNHIVAKIMDFCPSVYGTEEMPIADRAMFINIAKAIVNMSKGKHGPEQD